jgi:hypothetical protein
VNVHDPEPAQSPENVVDAAESVTLVPAGNAALHAPLGCPDCVTEQAIPAGVLPTVNGTGAVQY